MSVISNYLPLTNIHFGVEKEAPQNVISTSSLRSTSCCSLCKQTCTSQLATTKMASVQYLRRSSETLRDVARDVVQLLKQAQETVGVAESLTGGSIMAALTSVEGASSVFRGGIVSYDTGLKTGILKVDQDVVSRHGVVHGEVARQMASGVRNVTALDTPTTWGLSTTGVAGPDSQDGKPAGTVFIGISGRGQDRAFGPFHFPGERDDIRRETIVEALEQLRKLLADAKTSSSDMGSML